MDKKVRTRFAPSPTGFMHIGNLRTGLYAYLFAKHNGGDFILRIEDTDRERFVEGAVEMIYSTLSKAGIDYDEGPQKDKGYGPYVQSERKELYKKYALELVEKEAAYFCFCKKDTLESLADENGVKKYNKHCLNLTKAEIEKKLNDGEQYVIRLNVPLGDGEGTYEDAVFGTVSVAYADMDDAVLLKSDGMPTYNFANVVDDHLMGITHVIRGSEYLSSTPMYNLIYDGFGWQRPNYMHLPPIMKDATRKLSKRFGDANFEDFLHRGFLPEAIVNYIALLGWCPKDNREKMTLQEMIEAFSPDGISVSPSIFDEAKMRWLNGEYMKELSDEEFLRQGLPYFEKSKAKDFDFKLLAPLLKTRVDIFSDIASKVDFLAEFGKFDKSLYDNQKLKIDGEVAKKCIEIALNALKSVEKWENQEIYNALVTASETSGIKKAQLLWVVRIAVTGQAVTPGGASEMAQVVGKEETLKRLSFSLSQL